MSWIIRYVREIRMMIPITWFVLLSNETSILINYILIRNKDTKKLNILFVQVGEEKTFVQFDRRRLSLFHEQFV